MSRTSIAAAILGMVALGAVCVAQSRRVASPPGASATELGGRYSERQGYVGGKWIEADGGKTIVSGADTQD